MTKNHTVWPVIFVLALFSAPLARGRSRVRSTWLSMV